MILFSIFAVSNFLDFIILYRAFSSFLKQKLPLRNVILISAAFSILRAGVNVYEHNLLNLACQIVLIGIFSLLFAGSYRVKSLIIFVYLVIGIMAEFGGILIMQILGQDSGIYHSMIIVLVMSKFIRLILVETIIARHEMKVKYLSWSILPYLYAISFFCVVSICLFILFALQEDTTIVHVMSITFILLVLIIIFSVFKILQRYTIVAESSYQNELLSKFAKYKDEYYQQIEESVLEVRRIRHDLRNRLLTLNESINDDYAKDQLVNLIGEIDDSEKGIFTKHPVVNAILNSKIKEAEKYDISVECSVHIPSDLIIDSGDIGIIIGNLVDNGIEANQKLDGRVREIQIMINFKQGCLWLEVTNSKANISNQKLKTTKKDSKNHGIGLKSVGQIIKKYDGMIEPKDMGEQFHVSALLYL